MRLLNESEEAIIIFTCDRIDTLEDSLNALIPSQIPIIILDDSTEEETKRFVMDNFGKYKSIFYHNSSHQNKWLEKISDTRISSFVTELNQPYWTLGYNRNYSLLLSAALSLNKIIWMDDDIIARDSVINKTISNLKKADFAGAEITGMPDNSVVGHMRSQFDLDPRVFPLSGGFLGININNISHYCINYYNEDWIWMALHRPNMLLEKDGSAIQQCFDPFSSGIELALWQELGEIIKMGVLDATSQAKQSLLFKEDYWDSIRKEGLKRITDVYVNCYYMGEYNNYLSICDALYAYYDELYSIKISSIFEKYFSTLPIWSDIFNNIRSKSTPLPCFNKMD